MDRGAWGKGEAGGPPAGRSAEDTHPGPLPSSPCCPSRQAPPPPPVQDSSKSMFLPAAMQSPRQRIQAYGRPFISHGARIPQALPLTLRLGMSCEGCIGHTVTSEKVYNRGLIMKDSRGRCRCHPLALVSLKIRGKNYSFPYSILLHTHVITFCSRCTISPEKGLVLKMNVTHAHSRSKEPATVQTGSLCKTARR